MWVVMSAAYVLAVGVFGAKPLLEEFGKASEQQSALQGTSYGFPIKCEQVLGEKDIDWTNGNPWEYDYQKICWYKLDGLRHYFPGYASLSPETTLKMTYARAETYFPKPRPWNSLLEGIGWVVGLPLFFLVVGSALYWAFSGFSGRPRNTDL